MNALTVSDLSVHNGEPTVQDLRLAELLGHAKSYNIRRLIQRNMAEVQRYGEVFSMVEKTSPSGGRPGIEYHLSEPQALLIAMKSDTERAADVREQLIRVFMAWRRGEGPAPREALPDLDTSSVAVWRTKIDLVREARIQFGAARARLLWEELGLPAVPGLPPRLEAPQDDEPERCLAHLLDWPADGVPLGEFVHAALKGDGEIAAMLIGNGIRVGNGVFTVANSHPFIRKVYKGTHWKDAFRFLRRIPGAADARVMKYGRNITSRGVELPGWLAEPDMVH